MLSRNPKTVAALALYAAGGVMLAFGYPIAGALSGAAAVALSIRWQV